MARTAKASKAVSPENGEVKFTFANGAELAAKLSDIPEAIRTQLALHGLSQKVGDSYAGAESVEDAHNWAKETLETLLQGKWSTRVSGSSKGPRVTLLAEAISRISGSDIADVIAKLDEMDEETLAKVRKNSKVKLAMNDIKAERLKKAAAEESEDDALAGF